MLHRLSRHLREQNWTAVAIEFLIVVAGVFVATEVANWNAERATRARGAEFSARLAADLSHEAWAYEYLVEYYSDVDTSAKVAVAALTGDISISDEAFMIAAYRATQYKYQERHRATYDELVSTGEIGLIGDDILRTTAVDVFTSPLFDIIREEGRTSEYRRIFRRIVPADVQRALLQACGDRNPKPGDYRALVGSLDYACTLGLAPERVVAAASALRKDPSVLPMLQLRFADLETTTTDLRDFEALPKLRQLARRAPMSNGQ